MSLIFSLLAVKSWWDPVHGTHDAIERKNVSRTECSDLTMKKSTWNC